jgi:hypothetical protein
MLYEKIRRFLKNWLPVIVWVGVIFLGSTDLMSAEHTSRFIVPFLRWLKPDISAETLASIHFIVRKCTHVGEYAILALLLLRAATLITNSKRSIPILYLSVLGVSDCGCHRRISPNVRRVSWRFGPGHHDRQ